MIPIEDRWTTERLLAEIKTNRAKAARMRPSLEKQVLMAHTSQLRSLVEARKWRSKPAMQRAKDRVIEVKKERP